LKIAEEANHRLVLRALEMEGLIYINNIFWKEHQGLIYINNISSGEHGYLKLILI
jgi:hypothetical protein